MALLERLEDTVLRANEPQTYPADGRQICPKPERVGLENNDRVEQGPEIEDGFFY